MPRVEWRHREQTVWADEASKGHLATFDSSKRLEVPIDCLDWIEESTNQAREVEQAYLAQTCRQRRVWGRRHIIIIYLGLNCPQSRKVVRSAS